MMNPISVDDLRRVVQDSAIEELASCFALVRPLLNEPDRYVVELWYGSRDVGVLVCDDRFEVAVPETLWLTLGVLEPCLGLTRRRHVRASGAIGPDHYAVQWLRMFIRNGRSVEHLDQWKAFGLAAIKVHLFRADGSARLKERQPKP